MTQGQKVRPAAPQPAEESATPWLDPAEQQVWRTLVAVHARLLGRLDAELEANHGISLADYAVLVNLSEAPGEAMRMAELAVQLAVSPSGLTRRLDGLVGDGLVERRPCPSDRRGTLAVLTGKGRAMLEQAAPTHVAGVRRYVLGPLQGKALRDLAAGLRLVGRSLDEYPPPSLGPSPTGQPERLLERRGVG